MSTEKDDLRMRGREARRALRAEQREAAAEAIASRVLALLGRKPVGAVLGYVATPEEADPRPLLEALEAAGARLALPRVDAPARLALHWVALADRLEPGSFGILEPAADMPLARPLEIDLVLVPGVAFDTACNRIGYGGCFYDNLLPLLRDDAVRIGLAFDEQIVEEIPAEDHDVRLDWVVTPNAEYRPAR
jgi:5-formyltetrahydrofolate cyclo-ligase